VRPIGRTILFFLAFALTFSAWLRLDALSWDAQPILTSVFVLQGPCNPKRLDGTVRAFLGMILNIMITLKQTANWTRLVFFAVATVFVLFAMPVPAVEQVLPLLQTKSGTYTNVTVTTKTKTYVFILHQNGMANISIADLSEEAKKELGYAVAETKSSSPKLILAKELVPKLQLQMKPFEERLRNEIPWLKQPVKIDRNALYIAGGVVFLLYLFFCYCCHLICIKSKKEASVLVWLPVLKWIPLLRAAEMSGWLILLMFIPIVPILWAFKIAKAREMSFWVGIFLLLPATNMLAFLYLAFAPATQSKEVKKFQSMSLQTA
jgi:hypothetical protein